ncbi:hypothetical protein BKA83DRAFT_4126818 [Pisolithus microcarpus]|nr:hypothetical protein BKA83DRAFT_4126818 [Pisolithus microcarpus]
MPNRCDPLLPKDAIQFIGPAGCTELAGLQVVSGSCATCTVLMQSLRVCLFHSKKYTIHIKEIKFLLWGDVSWLVIQLPEIPSYIIHDACQGSPEAISGMQVDFNDLSYDDRLDTQVDGILYDTQELDLQDPPGPSTTSSRNDKYFPGASQSYPSRRTFMDQFFSDQYGKLHKENLFYLFASQEDWQIALWLLHSHLSMAAIDSFLSLNLLTTYIQIKQLPLSFQTARELHHRAELLPSGPHWHSQATCPQHLTKRSITLFYRDPIKCLQSLLSHPYFEHHTEFVPRKVWSTTAKLLCGYDEWLMGDHKELPEGATLLGIILSSDKTNISVMSSNRMAHPLLISLANITTDIHSKGSLHGHLLLALLPIPSFIHKTSCVCSLLSNRLFHFCLDLVLKPLKIAASISVMMNDPSGNVQYCYMPLVGYITNTPEQSLLACTGPKVSPMSTATYKEFGNDKLHDPRTAKHTLNLIRVLCTRADPDDIPSFLKVAKSCRLNGVHEPFWRDWPLSDPAQFLKVEPLHHFFRMSWDHNIQWCITVVGEHEINYRFNLLQTPVGYHSFTDGISKLKQVTGHDHRSIQHWPSLMFHTHKDAILAAGGHTEHFQIPKLEFMQHVMPSICALGAPMQWSTDITKHAHVTEIKNPARAGNNQNYYAQIARHLDHSDKCFRFDLATGIVSFNNSYPDDDDNDNDLADEDHEPDDKKSHTIFYHSPMWKIVDYFNIAGVLSDETSPHPKCRRHASLNCGLPSDKIQIWTKVCIQVRNYHNPGMVKPAQTMNIAPPSQEHPCGLYNSAVFSLSAESDWPAWGLNGHMIVQLRLVFRMLGTDQFLTYVQRFHVTPPTGLRMDAAATGLHILKRAQRNNGERIGDRMSITPPPPSFRNAITELSITPLHAKTSSVPLDGRVFKAATLDAELATELEGATIFEAPQGSKDSYVIYWYELSHLENIGRIRAELLKTIHDMPLFCKGCWEPSLIPHMLRQSTANPTEVASSSSSGSGTRTQRPQSNLPHHSHCQSTSKQPTTTSGLKRHSRASLRQELVTHDVPDTDLKETVEGTLIPITGSEETVVATWLNQIIASFTPLASQSKSSQSGLEGWNKPCLTRSASKVADTSKMHHHLCLWSSQYTAKLVENSHMSVKPDIILCGQLDQHTGFAWHNVISFLELMSSTHSTQLQQDITCKAYAVFMSQPSRRFIVAISLACQEFHLHIFNCSGTIHSLGHNLHKSADLFTRLMYTLAFGSPDMLGFDPTFIDPTISPSILYGPRSIPVIQMSRTIYVRRTAYTVLCHIYISHLICGRGTNSWLVKKGKQLYVVKDYWTHEGRKHTEEEILLKVKGLMGVSQLVEAWTIQMEGADETTDQLQPTFLVGNIEFETHLHRHLLLTPVGDPLAQFSSLQELGSKGYQAGTMPFMAINLLREHTNLSEDFIHMFSHDLESLIYVLIWICILYQAPNEIHSDRSIEQTCLKQWALAKTTNDIQALCDQKIGQLSSRSVLSDFMPYFEPLKPTVT